jgi:hypothetical protein
LVLVLPQVDLLDTAFQRGTAPIAIHAQGTGRPAFQIISLLLIFFVLKTGLADQRSENRLLTTSTHAVRILNHCFRC